MSNNNINLEKDIYNLKNELNNIKDLLNQKMIEINNLKIHLQNKENNIIYLNTQLSNKINELNNIKNNINNNYDNSVNIINPGEKAISALFVSSDQNIQYAITCKNTTPFVRIEENKYNSLTNRIHIYNTKENIWEIK
jgi:regulator of replication initiation timing